MPLPSQIGYYRQHMNAFDMAEANPSGVEVVFDSKPKAIRWRQMAYTARKLFVERTGQEDKWAGLRISLSERGPDWVLLISHEASEPSAIIPLDGQYEVTSSLDKHLAEVAVEDPFAGFSPGRFEPEASPRPLGRTTVKPAPLSADELGEIEIGQGPEPSGSLIE